MSYHTFLSVYGLELLLEKAHVFPWGQIYIIIGVVFT